MPLTAIDYSKTIMYKIVCKDLEVTDEYVGHTTDFEKRKNSHKTKSKTKSTKKVYITVQQNGGWENWTMIEIEKFQCKDAKEAKARE
jgi:hypothetical protein